MNKKVVPPVIVPSAALNENEANGSAALSGQQLTNTVSTANTEENPYAYGEEDKFIGYVLVLKDRSTSSLLEETDLISMPMIFEESQLEDPNFSFLNHIDNKRYELVFVQSHSMLKQQLVALRKLAKENSIELQ